MFIELVDSLRCVEPHEDSWLVLATRRVVGRSVIEGTLGCPVCRRTYQITGGVAYLGAPLDAPPLSDAGPADEPDEDATVRLAALLGLASPGGLVVLVGAWARYARSVLDLVPVRLLLLDPSGDASVGSPGAEEGISVVRTAGGVVPVAAGAARAIALDPESSSEERIAAAVRVLGAGGRLVAPAHATVPQGARELARDDDLWVAERDATAGGGGGAPVALRRARRGD